MEEQIISEINEEYFNGYRPKEDAYSVKPEDKFKFINRIILDYLELRKGYASKIKDLVNATGFDRDTI
jgi:hypothetical protein